MNLALVGRLTEAVANNLPLAQDMQMNENEEMAPPDDGFTAHTKWKLLVPNENDVVDKAVSHTIEGDRSQYPAVQNNIVEGQEGAAKKNYKTTFI